MSLGNTYQAPMANGEPHPLKDVNPLVLVCARREMREIAQDLHDPEQAEPIVMALHKEGWL